MSRPADDPTEPPADAELSPSEAFALLGNETRLEILQALHDVSREREPDEPVPFSELYDRTGMDDSAHFNYHLKQLRDHFVRKESDGYVFRTPGWKVVRSVFAGTFTGADERGPFDAPGDCYHCGGGLQARYANEMLTIECADCGRTHVYYRFPPGGLEDRTPEEFLDAFHHHVRHQYCLAADGVCPECMGRTRTTLDTDTEVPEWEVAVTHECDRCDNAITSTIGVNLLDAAEVLTFHSERCLDLTVRHFWRNDWCVSDRRTTVLSEDPVRARLELPCGDETLAVTVDETLSLLETEVVATEEIVADD